MSDALLSGTPPQTDIRRFEAETVAPVLKKPLTLTERIWRQGSVRKSLVVLILIAIWQIYAVLLDNTLLFPTFTETLTAFWEGMSDGTLLDKTWASLSVLLAGYSLGILLAVVLSSLAITTQFGNDVLETLTAMFNPLPAIALLPLSLIWFGLGVNSIVFVLVHAVVWPVALNMHSGFSAVPATMRMVGQNYDLRGIRYVMHILIPAALPSILSGLKIGWAFAWRTLIAAELVFGVTTGGGGLGWFIYENKNILEIPAVFSGLLMVILVGLVVDSLIFRVLEHKTVVKWGMRH